jgi:ubiquinone/menaquinone biosynthesis C-methylase UbiE
MCELNLRKGIVEMEVAEADRILQDLWNRDVQAWDTYWAPIFRKFAYDLVRDVHVSAGSVVLDVGTGTGVAAAEAAKCTTSSGSVVGIDRSPSMLELARTKCASFKNLSFLEMNAEQMTFPDGSFDTVISNVGMSYATFSETISEIFRVTRNGESFAFNDWHLLEVPAHRTFSQILRKHRREHPSENLSKCRAAVAIMEHVGNKYSDPDGQAKELARAGFVNIQFRRRDYKIRLPGIREYLTMRFEREVLKQELNELTKVQREAFMKELKAGLNRFVHNGRFLMEWKVTFTYASKPS